MSNLAAEERVKPIYDRIKHGRMHAFIYPTVKNGKPDFTCECFRFFKETPHARTYKRAHRFDHEQDFRDALQCLADADRWMNTAKGRQTPPAPSAAAPDLGTDEIGFSLGEVTAMLHLLASVRTLDTESKALWGLEKEIRSALSEFSSTEVTQSVAAHDGSELYHAIEGIRKKLTPHLSSPQAFAPRRSPNLQAGSAPVR